MKKRALVQLAKKQRTINLLRQAVIDFPELPEDADLWATDTELRISLPYDIKMLKEVRKAIGANFSFYRTWNAEDGDMMRYYGNDKVNLIISLLISDTKSTCQRIKVGEKVEPVYKVICS